MRYADGGGLTAEGRSRREQVRLQAAKMFAEDADARQIAWSLRVSTKSVYQWRRAWRAGGEEALASKGPGGNACKLDEDQLARLSAALDAGPAACGWDQDQRWTLHRLGFTPHVAAHRAAERDEDAIAAWRAVTWAKVRG